MSESSAPVPGFLYGTAWKEGATESLVLRALEAGFRGVDTANQRRHYVEAAVGAALRAAAARGLVRREELFVQTKFTHLEGQDARLPYDPKADTATQVRQSFESSLAHLGLERIDAYVLHGPSSRSGLGPRDREAWRAMSELKAAGKVRFLGISNVTLEQLEELWTLASERPAFVQNRCFARLGWDRAIRFFCRARGVVYQGFSLLTANVEELRSPALLRLAARHGKTAPQVVFRFAQQVGMLPLTGTSDPEHMREDLDAQSFDLSDEDLERVETIASA